MLLRRGLLWLRFQMFVVERSRGEGEVGDWCLLHRRGLVAPIVLDFCGGKTMVHTLRFTAKNKFEFPGMLESGVFWNRKAVTFFDIGRIKGFSWAQP